MTEETGAASVEETLTEAAVATEAAEVAKPKRVRKPKLDADGNPIVKAVKTPVLDADGNPVPVIRSRILPSSEESTITVSEEQAEKITKYKGQRAAFAALLKDGQTIAQYILGGGDKGFLSFYVRDGACSVKAFHPADAAPAEAEAA